MVFSDLEVIVTTLDTIYSLPQVVKTWSRRETTKLSLWANILMLTNLCLWPSYGILLDTWLLIIANLASIFLVRTIVSAKPIYK